MKIHSEGGSKLVHGNIKSPNILLNQDLTSFVSDYGLSTLINPPINPSRVVVGYRAPEIIETRKFTQKSDIYSFGVLLMEILTGTVFICSFVVSCCLLYSSFLHNPMCLSISPEIFLHIGISVHEK